MLLLSNLYTQYLFAGCEEYFLKCYTMSTGEQSQMFQIIIMPSSSGPSKQASKKSSRLLNTENEGTMIL
jgi:hypothetical protein